MQINNIKIKKIQQTIDYLIKRSITDKFKCSGATYQGTVDRGIKRLAGVTGSISDERIVDFIVYQIYRYKDMIAEYPGTRWEFTWLWSDNAVAKYHNQYYGDNAKVGINYYINQWLAEFDLTRDMLVGMLDPQTEHSLSRYLYLESEEGTKQRFLNTEIGKLNCFRSTTGWSPLSPTCQQCQFNAECIRHFEGVLPELIRIRKEKQVYERNN